MKALTSRILALVVALTILLLPATTLAEERNYFTLTLSNFEISDGTDNLTFPISLSVSGGADPENERGAMTAAVLNNNEAIVAVIAALEDNELRATLSGLGYNLRIPVEQLTAILEQQLTSIMEQIGEESLAQLEGAFSSFASSMESLPMAEGQEMPQSIECSILDLFPEDSITDKGEDELFLFVDTFPVHAYTISTESMTMNEWMEMLRTKSAENAFIATYVELMESYMMGNIQQALDLQGEEITVNEIMEIVSIAVEADYYECENGLAMKTYLHLAVEDETYTLPIDFSTLTTDTGFYFEVVPYLTTDEGQLATITLSLSDAEEDGTSTGKAALSVQLMDEEFTEIIQDITLDLCEEKSEKGVNFDFRFSSDENEDSTTISLSYSGEPVQASEETDIWNGSLQIGLRSITGEGEDAYEQEYALAFNTALTASSLPEGSLLDATENDINIVEADEETMEKVSEDAQRALMRAMAMLTQIPEIAALMGEGVE